jgi:transcriptional regulator with XRE-family HTH domain
MKTPTGKLIKRLRQQKGQKQADVAKDLDISIPAYSKIEGGITDINLSRLLQIANLFGVAPSSLLPGADTEEPPHTMENEQLKDQLKEANTEILQLQSKLINLYDEIAELKKSDRS